MTAHSRAMVLFLSKSFMLRMLFWCLVYMSRFGALVYLIISTFPSTGCVCISHKRALLCRTYFLQVKQSYIKLSFFSLYSFCKLSVTISLIWSLTLKFSSIMFFWCCGWKEWFLIFGIKVICKFSRKWKVRALACSRWWQSCRQNDKVTIHVELSFLSHLQLFHIVLEKTEFKEKNGFISLMK